MSDDIRFNQLYHQYIGTTPAAKPVDKRAETQAHKGDGPDFARMLNTELTKGQVNFSKHAKQRVDTRQVEISPQLMNKLGEAISQARDKGINDALILSDKAAFIVNVPKNTVVTTLNQNEAKNRIFTNIDGTVMI